MDYKKRPLWQWLVIYVIIGGIIYAVGYFVFFKGLYSTSKSSSNPSSSTSQSSQNSSTTNPPANSNSANSTQPTTSGNMVSIQNFAFSPSSITVKKGTSVTWTNQDSTGHTVTETDGKTGPNSSTLDNGGKYSFTFNQTGTFQYHCSIHSSMTGSVTVTE